MAEKSYPKKFAVKRKWKNRKNKKNKIVVRCAEIPKCLEIERTSGSLSLQKVVGEKKYKAIKKHYEVCPDCKQKSEHNLDKV